ncbi:MAG TPA: sulfotransferase [Streptosporangiaceae bacterium]|nr:sulfotransferase [Streptosporangiaceae bacterium]
MKLIGAGLPRTGTLTQKIALEMLGFGPCYHMVNVLTDLGLVRHWSDAFEGTADWDEVFAGHESTVDWPGSFFYPELIQRYPDAKVLLSVRPAAGWAKSMTSTIWDVVYGDSIVHDLSQARTRVDQGWADYMSLITRMWEKSGLLPSNANGSPDPDALADAFDRYNAEVQAIVPADRLLVWSYTDGWEPLCEFLEVPVPQVPLPRVNDSKMFVDRIVDSALATLSDWYGKEKAAASQ